MLVYVALYVVEVPVRSELFRRFMYVIVRQFCISKQVALLSSHLASWFRVLVNIPYRNRSFPNKHKSYALKRLLLFNS